MSPIESVNDLLIEMKQISIEILGLSYDSEENLEKLDQLQLQQQRIRNQIDQLSQEHYPVKLTQETKSIIKECMDIEQRILEKFKTLQFEASQQILNFQSANMAKKAYQYEYAQQEGYFLDKHR